MTPIPVDFATDMFLNQNKPKPRRRGKKNKINKKQLIKNKRKKKHHPQNSERYFDELLTIHV